jgi:DNA polymerase-3 subunit epsilon
MMALVRAAARAQRLRPLQRAPELVAARRRDGGGWELIDVRHGRLAGTTVSPPGADPLPYIAALRETAEVVSAAGSSDHAPTALTEETELILRWLESPGVRLVELDGRWTCPVDGAGGMRAVLEPQAAHWHEVDRLDPAPSSPLERPPGAVPAGAA